MKTRLLFFLLLIGTQLLAQSNSRVISAGGSSDQALSINGDSIEITGGNKQAFPHWNFISGSTIDDPIYSNGGVSIGDDIDDAQLSITGTGSRPLISLNPAVGFTNIPLIVSESPAGELFRLQTQERASNNLFFGRNSGFSNVFTATTDGSENTFLGNQTGVANVSGYANDAIGFASLFANTTGSRNCALGYFTLGNNVNGNNNLAAGTDGGAGNTNGNDNVYLGYHCAKTPTPQITGSGNVFVGSEAASSLTDGSDNVGVGRLSAYSLSTGVSNVFVGRQSGFNVTTGSFNVFNGRECGNFTTTGSYNYGGGYRSLYNNIDGSYNVGLGYLALFATANAVANTAVGALAGRFSLGSNGTYIGYLAGARSGTGGVYLGYRAGDQETSDNKLYIDNSNTATPLIYGDFAQNYIKIHNAISLPVVAESVVPNESLFYDAATLKLSWKDGSGTVNALY